MQIKVHHASTVRDVLNQACNDRPGTDPSQFDAFPEGLGMCDVHKSSHRIRQWIQDTGGRRLYCGMRANRTTANEDLCSDLSVLYR